MKLETDGVILEFGDRRVLQSVSAEVSTGEICGLLGKNGSGKSSLLKVIYGTLQAAESSVRVDGKYVARAYKQKNLIGFLPQKAFVPSYITPTTAFRLYGADIKMVLESFPELSGRVTRRFSQLSGGEVRLFETLLVIASPSRFLLLDEPFSSIMPIHVEKIKNLLLIAKQDKGIIITDHYYREVLDISDRICHLDMSGYLTRLKQPLEDLKRLRYIS